MLNALMFFGHDGIVYNWEAYRNEDADVIAFHKALYKEAKARGFADYNSLIYTSTNFTLDEDNYGKLYGTKDEPIHELFLNYPGGYIQTGLKASEKFAEETCKDISRLYAGVHINSMSRNWEELKQTTKMNLIVWGEHTANMIYTNTKGATDGEWQTNYQMMQERFFSGGHNNPAYRPDASQAMSTTWQSQLTTFCGLSEYMPERSAISKAFLTHFNLGNGNHYYYKGAPVTEGGWYNMASQDIVPTYRWLVLEANSDKASDKINPEITYKDAYMGGSCLLLSGTGNANATDLVLYKTDIAGSTGAINANVAIKSGKEVAADSKLFLIVHLKNNNEWKEFAIGGTKGKTWEEKKIPLDGITSGTVIDKIGLRVKNSTSSYKMMVGKLELVDGFTAAPSGVKNVAIQVKEETKSSLSVKATWAVDKAETTTGMIYNDDANIDHFEILLKDGTNGRVSEVARTSQWAAYVGNIDLKNFTNNPFIGVRAVSKDLKSYSPVVWTEVTRANAEQLPELVLNPYTNPELDLDADGYKNAQAIRYVEIFRTKGGSTNINYQANGPTGGTNFVDVTSDPNQVLTIGQGETVTLEFKGFEAKQKYKDGKPNSNGGYDDLRYCFGRGWIDLNGDHRFDPRELTVNPKEGEQLFTIGELRKGVPDQVQKIVTKTFTIPADARIGDTRMRIVFSDAWFKGALKPTGKFNKGFAIDFRVKITGSNKQRPVPADTRDQGLADEPAGLSTTGVSNVAVAPSQLQQEGNSLNFANVEKAWIFAADGSLVAALNNPANYNLSSLASGVYLVKMQNKNIIRTQKITVK